MIGASGYSARMRASALRSQVSEGCANWRFVLGPKTNRQLAQPALTWERKALARIRAEYPDAPIIYRPKREDGTSLPGTRCIPGPTAIETVLKGASLVVCRHSNVAIDAAIAGIPVVCEDGAAAALYDNDLADPVVP